MVLLMIESARVYTIAEAADLMRLPYRSVRDAVFAGRWPHVMVSQRKRLMTGEDIHAALALMRKVPITPDPVAAVGAKGRIKALLAS